MDAHLGAHRTLSAWASAVPLASYLSPSGPPVHPRHQLGGAGALPHLPSLEVQHSALHMAAPSSRKGTKSHSTASGKVGTASGSMGQSGFI